MACFGNVSDLLCLEMMRKDAEFHPSAEKFDAWSKGGECPYKDCDVMRKLHFQEKRELWQPGKPTMTDYELLLALFEEKKWKLEK